jgi:hypothetical protein
VVIPGKPSARLNDYLKLNTGQRFLRFSILKETPTVPQALSYLLRSAGGAGDDRIVNGINAFVLVIYKTILENGGTGSSRMAQGARRTEKQNTLVDRQPLDISLPP